MTTKTRASIGKANRDKGARAERALVTWLRTNGWPHAERAIATGNRSGQRVRADLGDVTGTPGLVWQVKNVNKPDIDGWLAETEEQRAAADADYGLLVQQRRGQADPGMWWVHVHGSAFAHILTGEAAPFFECTVRVALREFAPYLWDAGYGTPVPVPVSALITKKPDERYL